MIDDFSPLQLDEKTKNLSIRMNLTQTSDNSGSISQQEINSIDIATTQSNSGNSTSSSSHSDRHIERLTANNLQQLRLFEHHQQQQQHEQDQSAHQIPHRFDSSEVINYDLNNGKFETNQSSIALVANNKSGQSHQLQTESTSGGCINMSVDSSHNNNNHNNMIPAAHSSDQSVNYQQVPKSLPNTGTSNMAFNLRPDLFLQPSHHSGTVLHQDPNNGDHKSQLHNSFELDSGSLMQASAAVNMNMWKSTMGLNHFKHTSLPEHSFLQAPDMNTLSNWPHGSSIAHQQSSMTQHILDNPTLISYQQHRGAISLPNQQDLVGATLKNQSCAAEQAFVLNTINQASIAQPTTSSNHHQNQPHNNISLRAHQEHSAGSYNLTTSDNQFYTSSRSETRSHPNSMKPTVLVTERPAHMGLGNHTGHLTYSHSINHNDPQPTTSQHMASNSSAGTSKNVGSFRCATCDQVFSLRNQYQSHLKTHSQEKGSKVKFCCEICGHSFSQKTSLNRHMKSHTGERPFPCEVCGKAFSEKERLKIHMRTHTGEKPFSCGICGKSFSQKSTVKRHQTVHTGEKKFKCDCGKGFANRGNLIAHIKTRGANHFE